jgi:hypothetical protein
MTATPSCDRGAFRCGISANVTQAAVGLEGFSSRETDWATIILFSRSHWRPRPIDTDLDREWHPQGNAQAGMRAMTVHGYGSHFALCVE